MSFLLLSVWLLLRLFVRCVRTIFSFASFYYPTLLRIVFFFLARTTLSLLLNHSLLCSVMPPFSPCVSAAPLRITARKTVFPSSTSDTCFPPFFFQSALLHYPLLFRLRCRHGTASPRLARSSRSPSFKRRWDARVKLLLRSSKMNFSFVVSHALVLSSPRHVFCVHDVYQSLYKYLCLLSFFFSGLSPHDECLPIRTTSALGAPWFTSKQLQPDEVN